MIRAALAVPIMIMIGCGSERNPSVPTSLDRASGGHDTPAATASEVTPMSDRPSNLAADQALLDAARRGDATAAETAIARGANVEARDDRQRTALLIAATNDSLALARVLVAHGASPDALDSIHDTPWLMTGETGSVPMAEILLSANPDLTIVNRYGGVSIIPASERGHVEYVRRVVKTSMNVNHVNRLGWTALLECVVLGDGSNKYQAIARILKDAGANVSIKDHDGVDALEHARRRGYKEIVGILEAP
jgi:uncharacterized protein